MKKLIALPKKPKSSGSTVAVNIETRDRIIWLGKKYNQSQGAVLDHIVLSYFEEFHPEEITK